MKLQEIIEVIEKIAPLNLKEDFDNVGLMIGDRNKDITKVLIALDCTLDVIEEGKNLGVQLILTHHPLLFKKPSTITMDTLLGKKIINLIKNDINLYAAHTNWDSVKNGLNDTIVSLLGYKYSDIISINSNNIEAGIGRIVYLDKEKTIEEIIKDIKYRFDVKHLRYVGALNKQVKTIAIINGSGQEFFEASRKLGADLIITGDTTYHFVSDYKEMGLGIIDMGHFNSEWTVVKELSKNIEKELCTIDKSLQIFISESSKDPYDFI